MKRWLFILGIVLILILIAVWVFLLFASEETKNDVYSRFGFTGTTEEGIVDDIIDVILPDLEPDYVPLRQLTTKRVTGYTEVVIASSTPQIFFSEAGTGHIYSLNLSNGVETKISNITVPGAYSSHISKNGTFAAIATADGSLTLVMFAGGTMDSLTLGETIQDFTITDDDQLLYTTNGADGVVGKIYDIETKTSRTIFTSPFRQGTVVWGDNSEATHYLLPKPARTLEGYLYSVTKGILKRTPISGYGLVVLPTKTFTLFSKANDNQYSLYIQNNSTGNEIVLDSLFFPEKCTVSSQSVAFCAQDLKTQDAYFPDNWYRGETSYADSLWSIGLNTLETNFLLSTLDVTGRELDIIDLSLTQDESGLLFRNKNDYTLWMYDVVSKAN